MKLLCYLKGTQDTSRPVVLLESNNIEELKAKAIEYAKSNPSFQTGWTSNSSKDSQELMIDFDYRLEIQE